MTEAGFPGSVQPRSDSVWTADPEVPDADADEQRRELEDNPEEIDPETVAGRDRTHHLVNLPLEVSEADLADQLMDVPIDDDHERD